MSHDTGALLVVGRQNDACEGGALVVAGGHGVSGGSDLLDGDDPVTLVVASRDQHGPPSTSQGVQAPSASETVSDTGTPLLDVLHVGVAADRGARALEQMRAGIEVGR